MSPNQLLSKLTEIVRDILDDPSIVLTRESTADDVEDWDSLAHINIILAIEREFHLKFDLEELKPMENVGTLLDIIQSKLAPAAEAFGELAP
jgi:acyl carrier protein